MFNKCDVDADPCNGTCCCGDAPHETGVSSVQRHCHGYVGLI